MTLADVHTPAPSAVGAAPPSRPRAKARGVLALGDARIGCYVLADGRPVLAASDLVKLFTASVAKHRDFARFSARLSKHISGFNASPKFEFDGQKGRTFGYEAATLPRLCRAVLRAARLGKLRRNQAHIVDAADDLLELIGDAGITALVYEAVGLSSDGIASASVAATAERQAVEHAVRDALRSTGLDDDSAPATDVHRANAADATRALDELVAYALEGRDDAEQIRPTVRACFRQEVARRAGVAGRRWGRWGAETHGAVLAEMRGVRSIAKACSRYPAVRRAARRGRIALDGQLALNGVFVGTATAIDEAGR